MMEEKGLFWRRRLHWAVMAPGVVVLGLVSRRPGMPAWVHAYAGDALYAVLLFVLAGVLAPGARTWARGLGALAACWIIEVSQAWHPAWLDAARATRAGALVLGRGFLWSDLLSYAVGVALGVLVEGGLGRRLRR
jgi:hypothetical protein